MRINSTQMPYNSDKRENVHVETAFMLLISIESDPSNKFVAIFSDKQMLDS